MFFENKKAFGQDIFLKFGALNVLGHHTQFEKNIFCPNFLRKDNSYN